MDQRRVIGIVLLILGIGLLIVGVNSSHSFADQLSNTFLGRFTQATTWYLLCGSVSTVTGLFLTFVGPTGKSA